MGNKKRKTSWRTHTGDHVGNVKKTKRLKQEQAESENESYGSETSHPTESAESEIHVTSEPIKSIEALQDGNDNETTDAANWIVTWMDKPGMAAKVAPAASAEGSSAGYNEAGAASSRIYSFATDNKFRENAIMTVLQTEEFVEEVKKYPVLWQSSHKMHKHKFALKKYWEEIQATRFPDLAVDDLKKRWKNLRDQYRKELKKFPPGTPVEMGSQWRYFECLSFLRDEMTNLSEDSPEADDDPLSSIQHYEIEVPQEPEQNEQDNASVKSDDETEDSKSRKRPQAAQIREEMIAIEKKKLKIIEEEIRKNEMQRTENYHFLISLLPELEKLRPLQKMRFRSKVTAALLEEMNSTQNGSEHSLVEQSIDIPIKQEMDE